MLEEKVKKDENAYILAKWIAGIPAATIAAHIGGDMTRSAVIERVRTMKAQGLLQSDNRLKVIRVKATVNSDRIEKTLPGDFCVHPAHRIRSIALLEDDQCKWPIGDPKSADFHFCCAKRSKGLSYCDHHVAKAKAKE